MSVASFNHNWRQNVETLFVQGLRTSLPFLPKQCCIRKIEAMTTRAPICSTNIEPGERGAVFQRLLRGVVTLKSFVAFAFILKSEERSNITGRSH